MKAEVKTAVRIAGIGSYVPERIVRNDDVLNRLKTASQSYLEPAVLEVLLSKVKYKLEKAGSVERRWCAPDEYGTDMATIAARQALEDAGMAATELDYILYTGMSKALLEPATAHILKNAIGATNANVLDTQDACVSFIKSLEIAGALIATGLIRTALVVCGERTSDFVDLACKTPDEVDWKFGSLMIGDAAGAFVLRATTEPPYASDPRHWQFRFRIRPDSWSTCTVGLNYRHGELYRLLSHSRRLFDQGQEEGKALMREIFTDPLFQGMQFDNVFCHEVSRQVEESFLATLAEFGVAIPSTHRSFFPEYGNVGSATLPVAVHLAVREERLRRGDMLIFACPSAGVQTGVSIFRY